MNTNKAFKTNKKFEDPELEAEIRFAKENGFNVPTKLASDIAREQEELGQAWAESETKTGKNTKAARKARSRGVSGCSGRKNGKNFDYGLDCIDFAYESNPVKEKADESSDEDDEDFFQFDMVVSANEPKIRSAIIDYFTNGNVNEAMESIDSYALTKDMVIYALKEIITKSLNHGMTKIKATSALLRMIFDIKRATVDTIIDAFEDVIGDFQNLVLDFPNAAKIFEHLLARIVYDEIFEIEDVHTLRDRVGHFDNRVVQMFKVTLGYVRNPAILRSIFEPTNEEPLAVIDSHFVSILREYASSRDKDNAACRLRSLGVPHYSHTFVFQSLVFAADKISQDGMDNIIQLLNYMVDNGFLTVTAVHSGFQLFFNTFDDLKFDLPLVYSLGKYLADAAFNIGIINRAMHDNLPQPGPLQVDARKRIATDDDDVDAGIGSLSSTGSGDEEAGVKTGFKSKYFGESDLFPVNYDHTVY